jgi:hypothetical protein
MSPRVYRCKRLPIIGLGAAGAGLTEDAPAVEKRVIHTTNGSAEIVIVGR